MSVITLLILTVWVSDASAVKFNKYADFTPDNSEFKGGYDVDSYGNRLYVNRNGYQIDVYDVTLHDTDGDGLDEPNQHPDNPEYIGPMEERTIKYIDTYWVPEIGGGGLSEIYAESDRIFFLNEEDGISEYLFESGVVNTVVPSALSTVIGAGDRKWLSHISRSSDGTWYAANELRDVYSWNGGEWDYLFNWKRPHGNHGDGMEIVKDPRTGIEYLYLSEMYTDVLFQYAFGDHDNDAATEEEWYKVNEFEYPGEGKDIQVEGMGYGALGHFWATSGKATNHLYEIGGGDLGNYIATPTPEPATFVLLGCGLAFWGFLRKKGRCKLSINKRSVDNSR